MGVDYAAVIAVGKTFDDKGELLDFVRQHYHISEEEEDEIEEDGYTEWLYSHPILDGEMLDCYRGDYCYLGYSISCSSPEAFKQSFEDGMEQWKSVFPNVEPDVIRTVKVY